MCERIIAQNADDDASKRYAYGKEGGDSARQMAVTDKQAVSKPPELKGRLTVLTG